jgi:hypothetical protein
VGVKDTDPATHIRTYNDKWGLRAEVALSQLTEAQRTLLRKRVHDAVYRLSQKLSHLTVLLLILDRAPLEQGIIDRFKEN